MCMFLDALTHLYTYHRTPHPVEDQITRQQGGTSLQMRKLVPFSRYPAFHLERLDPTAQPSDPDNGQSHDCV